MKTKYLLLILISLSVIFTSCSTRGKINKRVKYSNYDYDSTTQPQDNKRYAYDNEEYSNFDKQNIRKQTTKKYSNKYSHPTMRPYTQSGVLYTPKNVDIGDKYTGNASWYGKDFHGNFTSNGEVYDMYAMTAAHKTFPMNTIVEVYNHSNESRVIVRINDRGPFIATRIIDLSKAAAKKIGIIAKGTARVTIKVLGFQTKESYNKSKPISMKNNINEVFGSFYLQIASYSNIEGAIKMQEKYDGIDGYSTIIKDTTSMDSRIFKVMIGSFKSDRKARFFKEKHNLHGAFVVNKE